MYSCLGVHDLCLLLHPRVHRCHVSYSCGEEEQRGNGDYCEWLIMITMVIMIMGKKSRGEMVNIYFFFSTFGSQLERLKLISVNRDFPFKTLIP